ncbi:MAG: thioredoxin family protein, partial [Chryseobacterium sp.]
MKTLFSAIVMVVFAVGIHAQSRLENAKKQASQNKELILLNFSGSDWC